MTLPISWIAPVRNILSTTLRPLRLGMLLPSFRHRHNESKDRAQSAKSPATQQILATPVEVLVTCRLYSRSSPGFPQSSYALTGRPATFREKHFAVVLNRACAMGPRSDERLINLSPATIHQLLAANQRTTISAARLIRIVCARDSAECIDTTGH